jgi:hypothetical protein
MVEKGVKLMRRSALLLILMAAAMQSSTMNASAEKRGSRTERVREYAQQYQQICKPQLICTGDCQDLYDVLLREGVNVGGPCRPHQ